MQRTLLAAAAAACLLLCSTNALAQAAAVDPTSFAGTSMKDRTEALLTQFMDATRGVMEAESRVMAAVGMKTEADLARAQATAFVPEATPGQMEETLQVRTNGNAALAKKLAAGGVALTDAQKGDLSASIDSMAHSVKQFSEMMVDFPDLKKALRDAGLKRKKALFASRFLPQALSDSKLALGASVAFARANNIAFSPQAGELAK